ncbi:hypothetical protein [Leptospira meyeri]|uniref:hypothetical protein n=1 Tax=Leptospira meyeri TaxID=29508 RepID=UPI000C2A3A4B|nr:hypothetical protein [Leptospira meyeri]PJZ81532.1 hypothetical protein CH359_05960 [Leptospira meyeri]PJZ97034.1 hypothetical protein CH358_07630 [Leptospira meyeri]TGM19767.1 hypothetical protein EHQ73_15955 [Leptospira meyeri]
MDEKEQKERMDRINHQMHVNYAKSKRDVNLIVLCLIVPIFGFYFAKKVDDSSDRKIAYFCCFINFMITVVPLVYETWKDPY